MAGEYPHKKGVMEITPATKLSAYGQRLYMVYNREQLLQMYRIINKCQSYSYVKSDIFIIAIRIVFIMPTLCFTRQVKYAKYFASSLFYVESIVLPLLRSGHTIGYPYRRFGAF